MTDPQLQRARRAVAHLVEEAFGGPLEEHDVPRIGGALSVVESLDGADDIWGEFFSAVAAAHYGCMANRSLGSCGCGLSRLCRRAGTGFEPLAAALGEEDLMWRPEPPTAEEGFAALRAHRDAEKWPVPEFGIGVGTGFPWDDPNYRADWRGPFMSDQILHVLAFHGRALRVREIAADVDHPDLTGKQTAGRLRILKTQGHVAIHRVDDPETGESFNRWSYVPGAD